jgi:hypothetical protein
MIDNLGACPKCGCQDGCYIHDINETKKDYRCFNCGFYTNDLLIEGEFDKEEYESQFPQLYKDLVFVDSEKRCWYPQTINVEKGIVFANGPNKDNYEWSAILKKELTEEEKKMPRFKNQSTKSDPKTLKSFGKDFIEALDYVGVFDKA